MIVLYKYCSSTTDSSTVSDIYIIKLNVVTCKHDSACITTGSVGVPVAGVPTCIFDLAVFAFIQVSAVSGCIPDYDVCELTVVTVVVDCTGGTGSLSIGEVTVNYLTVVSTGQPVKTSTVGT